MLNYWQKMKLQLGFMVRLFVRQDEREKALSLITLPNERDQLLSNLFQLAHIAAGSKEKCKV